jgi:phosphopantetheine adenylyltransferase
MVWDGVVEVFKLLGHPKAKWVYAWAHKTDDPQNPKRYVAMLHLPPVVSPETAVRAASIQEQRETN